MDDAVEQVLAAAEAALRDRARVRRGDRMVVGVSGGVDSMVLLDALTQLYGRLDLHLCVAHLDHQLRAESAADARFVAAAAAERGLACHGGSADVPQLARGARQSPEEAARAARYAFYEQVMERTGSAWVALGHHADDQAETVLLHLLRGAGSDGLGAMGAVRDGKIVRPLLAVRRAQIEAYARRRGLVWRHDHTNRDLAVPRNRIRHELLPLLQSEYNPAVVEALCRAADILRHERDALDAIAQTALETVTCARRPGLVALAVPQVVRYHIAVQRRVLRAAVQALAPGAAPLGFDRLEGLVALLARGGVQSLGGGVEAQVAGGRLCLCHGDPPTSSGSLTVPGRTGFDDRGLVVTARPITPAEFRQLKETLGGWSEAFDADATGAALALRSSAPGDRLQPLGMEGRKLVSDVLVDAKVPRLLRSEHPLITSGENIIWVAGLRSAHPYRVRPESQRVLLLDIHRAGYPAANESGTTA